MIAIRKTWKILITITTTAETTTVENSVKQINVRLVRFKYDV